VSTPPPPPAPVAFERGEAGSRLNRWLLLGVFAGVLGVVLVVAAVVFTASEAPPPEPRCVGPACQPPKPPPPGDPLAPVLVGGELVTSEQLGYRLDVDTELWEVARRDATDIELRIQSENVDVLVTLEGTAGGTDRAGLDALVDAKVADLSGDILGLAVDEGNQEQVFPADPVTGQETVAVGYRSGAGGLFGGATDTPQGPGSPVAVVVAAASDGEITVVLTALTDEVVRVEAFGVIDALMNTFRFPTEVAE
jgi:hypothetical protein